MQTKACSKCKKEKPLEMFHKKPTGIAGRNSSCKACVLTRKKSVALKKKRAKERRTLVRSRQLDVSKMTVVIKPHPVPRSEFEEAVKFMAETINRHYLNTCER